ncbi:hypothetical protein [Nocardia thailandica]|uniref:hypothetical protein n=1 Tax=Nocardia thailandica TaxID=257275 RepID=UPI0002FD7790|nr:hypothetical protein [Nocardia thailandica]
MPLPDRPAPPWQAPDPALVYGEPHTTPDGSTVITVSRVGLFGRVKPLGLFVIRDGVPRWSAAVDSTRVALLGEFIGLVAATLATLALLRRPPWPDLSARVRER